MRFFCFVHVFPFCYERIFVCGLFFPVVCLLLGEPRLLFITRCCFLTLTLVKNLIIPCAPRVGAMESQQILNTKYYIKIYIYI